MRQAIRALGWASNIFWIILLFFTVTIVYSAFQIRPGFGEPYATASGNTFTASFPFYIENGGFYDITGLTLATSVNDKNGINIADSSTPPQYIPHDSNVSITHNMSISITQLTNENLSYLLFNDSTLNIEIALGINYANAVPFQISTNFTMPWGAPLSNLTLGTPSLMPTGVIIPFSFENHSFFTLDGTVQLEIVDNASNVVGQGVTNLNVQPQQSFGTAIDVAIQGNPANIREARLTFHTSVFNYGPVVIPLV